MATGPANQIIKDQSGQKDGNTSKDDITKKVTSKKRGPRTEYTTSYTEQPFSAREPIKPSAALYLLSKSADGQFCGPDTEYTTSFVSRPFAARQPIIPKPGLEWASGTFSDSTTTKADYITHKVEIPYRHRYPEWKQPDGQVVFSTSYNEDFPSKPIERVNAVKPNLALRVLEAKFVGQPTYRDEFREWTVPKPARRFQAEGYKPPSVPFGEEPTYSSDFIPRPIERRVPFKPVSNNTIPGNEPFSDTTDYKETFVQHTITPREVHLKDVYKGPVAPLESMTSNKHDYKPLPLIKVESVKPKNAVTMPTDKMDDSTTTKSDYVEWPVERYRPRERPKWQQPAEKMEFSTASSEDFKPYDIKPIKLARPPSRNRKLDAAFASQTQYQQDFPHWEKTPRTKPIIHESSQSTTEPFVGTSTYSTTFQAYPYEKPIRIKKDNKSSVLPLAADEIDDAVSDQQSISA